MVRRKFLGLLTLAGAGGAASAVAKATVKDRQTHTWKVDGFSCVTCATGLETILKEEKGVLSARATYPEGSATVTYDTSSISGEAITATIQGMGFRASIIS